MKRVNENLFSSLNQPSEFIDEEVLRQSVITNGMFSLKNFGESYDQDDDVQVDDFFSFPTSENNLKSYKDANPVNCNSYDNETLPQDFSRKSTTDTCCAKISDSTAQTCNLNSNNSACLTANVKEKSKEKEVVPRKHSNNPFKVIKPCLEETPTSKLKDDQTENMSSDLSMLKSLSGMKSHEIVKYKNRLAAKKHRVKKASYYKILEEENKLLKKILQGTYGSTELNKIIKSQISNPSTEHISLAEERNSPSMSLGQSNSAKQQKKSQHKKYENNAILPLNDKQIYTANFQNPTLNYDAKEYNNELCSRSKIDLKKDIRYNNNYPANISSNESRQVVFVNTPKVPRIKMPLPVNNTKFSQMQQSQIQDNSDIIFNKNSHHFYLNEIKDLNEDSSFNNIELLDLNKFDSLADSSEISLLGHKRYMYNDNETHSLLDNLNKPINYEDLEAFGKFGEKKPLGIFNYDNNYKIPQNYSMCHDANSGFNGLSQINNINNISICPNITDSCFIRQNCCSNTFKSCCCQMNQTQSCSSNVLTNNTKSNYNLNRKQSRLRRSLNTPRSNRKNTEGSLNSLSQISKNLENKNLNSSKKKQKQEGKLLHKATEMKLKGQKTTSEMIEKFSTISNDKVFSCLLEAKKEAIKTFLSKELSIPQSFLTENTSQGTSQSTLLVEELNNCLVQNFLKQISTCSK